MDSKLKAKAVLVSVIFVVLILATVWVADSTQKKRFRERNQANEAMAVTETQETPPVTVDSDLTDKYHLDPMKDPYAFMRDEAFFDKEIVEKDPSTQLSILVSSAARDVRVNIVDGTGGLVSGEVFEVTLTQKAETAKGDVSGNSFLDTDRDGSIYIGELFSGEYVVSLKEMENYDITGNDVPVIVKEQVEYTILKDISYLIKSEEEIDASKEDTAVNEAEIDADGTEHHQKLSEEDAVFGIDVSKWNKTIDWEKAKADGVEFAIIRCGYRGSSTGALVEDPYFKRNIEGATAAGVKVGIYFFTQAVNEVEAVEEASMVLSLIGDYKVAYPLYIDTEGAGGNGRADKLDKETRTAVVKAFCQTIDNSGFNAGIYASKNWYEHNLDMNELSGYQIWLAQYSDKATYKGDYSMWQYTSAGTIDGINGRVDLNLSYMAY